MKRLTMKQIEEGTGGRLIRGDAAAEVWGICTDSREAEAGALFFALKGENHDAHDYLPQVFASGCSCAVISNEALCPRQAENVILTEDTTKALQRLAAWYLGQLDLKKIAVTGSTGKTSTRDLTWYVCCEKYKTQKNKGNLNNHLGVPLTILSFDEDTEVGVLEMGMDKPGEIDLLARVAKPDIGIITNIGLAHIENLGSQEGIFQAKMELTNYFDENNLLIAARDEEFLNEERIQGPYRLVTAGTDGQSDYIISAIDDFSAEGIEFTLEHQGAARRFHLPVPGRHNAFNAALAVAAGMELGITMEEAARGLAKAKLTDKRLTVRGKNGIKVIDDTYNASPDSMRGAIDVLMKTRGLRGVAILGDMFELGKTSSQQHSIVGRYAAEKKVQLLIAIGSDARYMAQGAKEAGLENVLYFPEKEEFLKKMDSILEKGDVILVKGSRGMEMEQIVKKIME
ncbi:UDP-N-acetylmuramoyl-tripeptide--D-alanyl-D-alanine ligase [bacterium 210820-DFI.6.37]|nr:UDP-N-acetylmuramoyl-tripeptide--D-alanyl-D-alanine ligase [bacterium 210820-DFI.6.37]